MFLCCSHRPSSPPARECCGGYGVAEHAKRQQELRAMSIGPYTSQTQAKAVWMDENGAGLDIDSVESRIVSRRLNEER